MMRLLILLHRYLGIAVGLLILAWFISGFVMMFVQFPDWTYRDRLQANPPLQMERCCVLPTVEEFAVIDINSFYIEQYPRGPVLLLEDRYGLYPIDLATAEYLYDPQPGDALALAEQYRTWNGLDGGPATVSELERDQWTVTGYYDLDRPFYKVALGDAADTHLYVSSVSGEIVQDTRRNERFWSWIGPITHWLYPSILRQNTAIWAQVVIWSTLVALFLTVIGFVIGIQRYRFRGDERGSPYRRWYLWHHYSGLVLGVLIFTWLGSGLFSMNPWGWLESRSFAAEAGNLRAGDLQFDEPLRAFLTRLGDQSLPPETVRIEGSLFLGELQLVARDATGQGVRIGSLAISDLQQEETDIAAVLRPGQPVQDVELIDSADSYYYSHHNERLFPVHRIVYADGERFYIDPVSGRLLAAYDDNRRTLRWVFNALHQWDFAGWIRQRPLWYVLTGLFLVLSAVGVFTGVWLAARRILKWCGAVNSV